MKIFEKTQRFGTHRNAFGFLRLLFASLVIVSHVPELVDGDRDRELLSRWTGGTSFGELAVNGFFIISGFLIATSFLQSRSIGDYLIKRAARIYPAFVIASLFCLIVVAPLAGARLESGAGRAAAAVLVRMAMLARPMAPGAFAGQHFSDWRLALDGAMWTLQYEFLCYLLVIVLGWAGLLRRPAVLAALALVAIATAQLPPLHRYDSALHPLLLPATAADLFRLVGMFATGAAFRGVRDSLHFRWRSLTAAGVALIAGLTVPILADLAIAMLGGYLIFAAAALAGPTWIGRINDRTDVSYGLYLYAWPVQRLLMLWCTVALAPLGVLTWLIAVALGWLSWKFVERPTMLWARRLGTGRSGRESDQK